MRTVPSEFHELGLAIGKKEGKRCKVLTVKFPYLASTIDPNDIGRIGLHAIATKLFTAWAG